MYIMYITLECKPFEVDDKERWQSPNIKLLHCVPVRCALLAIPGRKVYLDTYDALAQQDRAYRRGRGLRNIETNKPSF